MNLSPISGAVIPGASGVTLLARVLGQDANPITQATISTIAYTLTNLTTGTAAGSGTFAVATAVFNTLVQNDPRWTRDSAGSPGPDGAFGYNFLAVLASTNFPISAPTPPTYGNSPPQPQPTLWQADVLMTPVSGQPFHVGPFRWSALPVYG